MKNADRLREIAASSDELDVGIGNDLRRIADEHEKLEKAVAGVLAECDDCEGWTAERWAMGMRIRSAIADAIGREASE